MSNRNPVQERGAEGARESGQHKESQRQDRELSSDSRKLSEDQSALNCKRPKLSFMTMNPIVHISTISDMCET